VVFFSGFLFPLDIEDLAEKQLYSGSWNSVCQMLAVEQKIQFKAREAILSWQAQVL